MYRRRLWKKEIQGGVKFLIYAQASCDETILHLNFINDIHKLDHEEFDYFKKGYDGLGRKINRFIKYVESEWK